MFFRNLFYTLYNILYKGLHKLFNMFYYYNIYLNDDANIFSDYGNNNNTILYSEDNAILINIFNYTLLM